MSSTLPDASSSAPASGSQPASPDVLEGELEDEVLRMLEAEVDESNTTGLPADPDRGAAGTLDADKSKSTFCSAFSNESNAVEAADEGFDKEVADALEAELFGGGADAAGAANSPASPDLSETDLFGPEDMGTATDATSSTAAANGTCGESAAGVAGDKGDRAAKDLGIGQKGLYYSDTQQLWYDCTVFALDADGGVKVSLDGSADKVIKTLTKERLATHFKISKIGQPEEEQGTSHAPDAAGAADREAQREMDEGAYDSKTSRFMRDEKGDLLHKWKVDYASRGGGGRAQCKDTDCLERHDQGGVRTIEKGCLRIGRRVLMEQESDGSGGHVVLMWHHARCIFNTFLRARKSTRTIETEFDIDGFDALRHEDKEMLRRVIDGNDNLRNVRFRSFDDGMPKMTPEKRSADGSDPNGPAAKRRRGQEERTLSKDQRVWTHFKCLPRDAAVAPGAAGGSVKSAKPELAMVREEITAGSVIVQFESQEHEKERVELYNSGRGKRIRGWLRYPRLFEGKKQRVPVTWINMKRDPPKLCGCKEQVWGHSCDCGISCNKGSMIKVFGVGDTPYA